MNADVLFPRLGPSLARRLLRTSSSARLALAGLGLLLLLAIPSRTWAQSASSDPLEEARSLLAAGDLEAATSKATQAVAAEPERGAAHLVLGLAHFRGGRYAEALRDFVAARSSTNPALPGPVAFNEGAALFALGRYGEAQACFDRAARIAPELRFLASTNAAEAALAAGDLPAARNRLSLATTLASSNDRQQMVAELGQRIDERAREARVQADEEKRERAKQALAAGRAAEAEAIYSALLADGGPALTNADKNLFAYGLGLSLLHQGRFAEAEQSFRRAAAYDGNDGDSLFMAGLAAYRQGASTAARALFEAALRRDVDGETAASARRFLDRLSFASRRGGGGGMAGASLGGGYDSNVIQGSDARPEAIPADQVGSAGALFATASANLGRNWLVRDTGFVGADYTFDQLAYPDRDHADYSLQDHRLRLRGEWGPGSRFRLGLLGSDDLQFAGLDRFRPFQNVLGIEPSVALDELPATSTYARLTWQKKTAFDPDYAYYGGTRLDLRLGQRLRRDALRAELAVRYRRERIGTRTATLLEIGTAQSFKFRKRKPTDPPDEASYVYVAPYAYDAVALLGHVEVERHRMRLVADFSAELLDFRGSSMVYFEAPALAIDRLNQIQSRRDLMLTGSIAAGWSLGEHWDLSLHYDVIDNRSTLVLDVDNRNYLKHVVGLALEASW